MSAGTSWSRQGLDQAEQLLRASAVLKYVISAARLSPSAERDTGLRASVVDGVLYVVMTGVWLDPVTAEAVARSVFPAWPKAHALVAQEGADVVHSWTATVSSQVVTMSWREVGAAVYAAPETPVGS